MILPCMLNIYLEYSHFPNTVTCIILSRNGTFQSYGSFTLVQGLPHLLQSFSSICFILNYHFKRCLSNTIETYKPSSRTPHVCWITSSHQSYKTAWHNKVPMLVVLVLDIFFDGLNSLHLSFKCFNWLIFSGSFHIFTKALCAF